MNVLYLSSAWRTVLDMPSLELIAAPAAPVLSSIIDATTDTKRKNAMNFLRETKKPPPGASMSVV
jgi:hypothetical protein